MHIKRIDLHDYRQHFLCSKCAPNICNAKHEFELAITTCNCSTFRYENGSAPVSRMGELREYYAQGYGVQDHAKHILQSQ
jgi:hypothetical protein